MTGMKLAAAFAPCLAAIAFFGTSYAAGADTEKAAVEDSVRAYEMAVQSYAIDKANALLAPGARWIEGSKASAADHWSGWWYKAKAAGVKVTNRPYDFDIRIEGSVAWVTLTVEVVCRAETAAGQKLIADEDAGRFGPASKDPREVSETFAESEVLLKTPNGWRIVLGHTSRIKP
jgi:hypothetical protein